MSQLGDSDAGEKSAIPPQPGSLSEHKDPSPLEAQPHLPAERTPVPLAWRLMRLPLWPVAYLYGSPNVFLRFLGPALTIAVLDAVTFQLCDWAYTCYILRRQYRNWALPRPMYWAYAFPRGYLARFGHLPLFMLVRNFLGRLHMLLFIAGFYALGGSGALMRLVDRVSFLRNRRRLREVVWYLIILAIIEAFQGGYAFVATLMGFSPGYYSL